MKLPRIFDIRTRKLTLIAGLGLLFTGPVAAAQLATAQALDLTGHTVGYAALVIFVLAYALVMAEEFTHLRKSKPVILAAGIMWLLVTLTAGVGGSMLSIGSAAGVALMGQARGRYTFFGHLKWTWAIGLGYAASIFVHMWINSGRF